MRRLKRKSIKRFKPQAFQASSFKTDPDFRQNDDSRAVIPDLIRNLCYCQKTQILTFVRMTATISVILNLIQNQLAKS
mgnify:CR=1 FL=1